MHQIIFRHTQDPAEVPTVTNQEGVAWLVDAHYQFRPASVAADGCKGMSSVLTEQTAARNRGLGCGREPAASEARVYGWGWGSETGNDDPVTVAALRIRFRKGDRSCGTAHC